MKKEIKKLKKKIKFSNTEFYFDDCIVCQFTKTMQDKGRQPTVSELKKVFQRAREEQKERIKNNKTDFFIEDEL